MKSLSFDFISSLFFVLLFEMHHGFGVPDY